MPRSFHTIPICRIYSWGRFPQAEKHVSPILGAKNISGNPIYVFTEGMNLFCMTTLKTPNGSMKIEPLRANASGCHVVPIFTLSVKPYLTAKSKLGIAPIPALASPIITDADVSVSNVFLGIIGGQ